MHNGSIEVNSEGEGKGSTFAIRLPIVLRLESDRIRGIPSSQHSRSKRSSVLYINKSLNYRTHKIVPDDGAPLQVLVVDDSELIRKMMTSTLSRLGYVVHCANDGAVAVDMIRDSLAANLSIKISAVTIDNVTSTWLMQLVVIVFT